MVDGFGDIAGKCSTDFDAYPIAKKLAFVDPRYFAIEDAINPHMRCAKSGDLNQVNVDVAMQQWQSLVAAYQSLGLETTVWEATEGCPDMVFCANQSLPYLDTDGRSCALMSHMASNTRQNEVAGIAKGLISESVQTSQLPRPRDPDYLFEGTGDALWVPGRKLLCGGYGFRTQPQVYEKVHEITGAPIVLLELKNPRFYHLDTCLSILDESTVLACRQAFTEDSWKCLKGLFRRIIEVPMQEADSPGFACNAHCPDQKHVIIHYQAEQTIKALSSTGFTPVAVDTSEFIKSGGSVFCMKLMYF